MGVFLGDSAIVHVGMWGLAVFSLKHYLKLLHPFVAVYSLPVLMSMAFRKLTVLI